LFLVVPVLLDAAPSVGPHSLRKDGVQRILPPEAGVFVQIHSGVNFPVLPAATLFFQCVLRLHSKNRYLFLSMRWKASCRATMELNWALEICTTVSCRTTSSSSLGTVASVDLVMISLALAETGFKTAKKKMILRALI
jgi:hypothetical protein